MAAQYPGLVASLSTKSDGDTIFASHMNAVQDEIIAIESALLNGFQHPLLPATNNTYAFGSTTKRWSKGWFQDLDIAGAVTIASGWTVPNGGTGATTLTAHGVLVGEGTGAIVATAAGTAGQVLTSGGGAADPTYQEGPHTKLLKANSGTDTSAGATTVDSIATGALTAKDTLLIYVTIEETTQAVARADLYSVTDAGNVARLTLGGTINAGVTLSGIVSLRQGQTGATKYIARIECGTTGGDASETSLNTMATNWTTGFTLGLRHGGVTGGGSFNWSWSVYKVTGQ